MPVPMESYRAVALSVATIGNRTMQRASVARLTMIAFLDDAKTSLSESRSRRISSRYRAGRSGEVFRSFVRDPGFSMQP